MRSWCIYAAPTKRSKNAGKKTASISFSARILFQSLNNERKSSETRRTLSERKETQKLLLWNEVLADKANMDVPQIAVRLAESKDEMLIMHCSVKEKMKKKKKRG